MPSRSSTSTYSMRARSRARLDSSTTLSPKRYSSTLLGSLTILSLQDVTRDPQGVLTSMPMCCIVEGCKSSAYHYEGQEPRNFHRLRFYPLLAKKWAFLCDWPKPLAPTAAVCSRHFEKDCYKYGSSDPSPKRKLNKKKHPLPTLHMCPPPHRATGAWKSVMDYIAQVQEEKEEEVRALEEVAACVQSSLF